LKTSNSIIGIKNVAPTEVVDHTVKANGTYWELNITTQIWSISSDPLGETSTITTTGSSIFIPPNNLHSWPGWNFIWFLTLPPNKTWATGFYKLTNDFNSSYFYVDGRDNRYAENISPYSNPDFFVYLDADNELYYYQNTAGVNWTEIGEFEILRIWDIHDVDPPNSNSLPDYWDNVLVSIDGGNDHPRFAWGPYDDINFSVQNYKVYRAVNNSTNPPPLANFSLVATLNSSTYEWIDNSFALGGPMKVHYYIKARLSPALGPDYDSDASNIVTFSVGMYKESSKLLHSVQEFNLGQNYPNPFNPATIIQFSIKNKSFISLKIYDILGNEVAVLIENFLEAGNHSIKFDASDLTSGIYMYRLQTDEISLTKKMILLQ